jgi:hypothetical protein
MLQRFNAGVALAPSKPSSHDTFAASKPDYGAHVRIFSVLTQVLVAVDAIDGKTKVSSNNEATW